MPVFDALLQNIPDTPSRNTHIIWEDDASIFIAFAESFVEILLHRETFPNAKGTTVEEATCRRSCAGSGRRRCHYCIVHCSLWRRRRWSVSGLIDCLKDCINLTFKLHFQVAEHCLNHWVFYFNRVAAGATGTCAG